MRNYSDEQILKGILRHDNLILQFIYKEYFYKVSFFIKKNQGSEDDANDVFQEAIIVIYRKLKENDLIFAKSSFHGYLFSVCRFLWLKQLEKRRIEREKINDSLPYQEDLYDDNLVELVNKNERYSLYQKHFQTLGTDCQKLMQLFFDKVPLKEIAKIMGYKGEKYAKTRKYKCKELLINRIKQDTEYKKYLKMIPKTEFFEWIENYCLEQLSEIEKTQFETELEHNSELRDELLFHQEIQSAILEKDVTNLREKLQDISKQKINEKENGTFGLLDDFANIDEINEIVSPEELINFYDSLPKVHVYQHELVSNENIHEFYKEQNKSAHNGEEDDSLNGFDFDDFEGLEEAVMETDILNLRETLSQVSKSVKLQFTTEDVDKFVNNELTGEKLEQFEAELKSSRTLREEVKLHREMENAVLEDDILNLRSQLNHIVNTETSWNVSEKSIEDYIDQELDNEMLDEFLAELSENTDLMAEVTLRRNVNNAIGEKDIADLREGLKAARKSAENTEIKSIIPGTGTKVLRTWKQYAAVMILLVGLTGVLNVGLKSLDGAYNMHYNMPEWSPERSVTSELNSLSEANIYYMNGNYEKAIELYDLALQKENEKYAFHFYKGASLQNMDKLEEAIPEYNQVIKHGNNLFIEEAEWNKSLCYVKLRNKTKAKEQLAAIVNRNGYYKNDAKAVLRRLKFSIR